MSNPVVRDNEARSRYEIEVNGDVAFLDYRRGDDVIMLVHTEVPEHLRGGRLASQLTRHALDAAREAGLQVKIRCPYVTAWIRRHPEYADLVWGSG